MSREICLAWLLAFILLFCCPGQTPCAAGKKGAVQAASVYDGQPAVTGRELDSFLETLPAFRSWMRQEKEEAHPVVRNGRADFLYSPRAAAWLEAHGWNAGRFFCVMGRIAAALFIIEEGNDMRGSLPSDMPAVSPEELVLARRNLGLLLKAGGAPATPIRR